MENRKNISKDLIQEVECLIRDSWMREPENMDKRKQNKSRKGACDWKGPQGAQHN